MLIYLVSGFIAYKKGLVSLEQSKGISAALMYIFAPCLLFQSFQQDFKSEKLEGLLFAVFTSIIANLFFIFLAKRNNFVQHTLYEVIRVLNLIDNGCNVIYTTSFGFGDATLAVAAEHPDVYFGHATGNKRADNVSTYMGKAYQPRYLSGIAAGLKTKSNKIGFVAAKKIPEVIRAINAFTLGVQSA